MPIPFHLDPSVPVSQYVAKLKDGYGQTWIVGLRQIGETSWYCFFNNRTNPSDHTPFSAHLQAKDRNTAFQAAETLVLNHLKAKADYHADVCRQFQRWFDAARPQDPNLPAGSAGDN